MFQVLWSHLYIFIFIKSFLCQPINFVWFKEATSRPKGYHHEARLINNRRSDTTKPSPSVISVCPAAARKLSGALGPTVPQITEPKDKCENFKSHTSHTTNNTSCDRSPITRPRSSLKRPNYSSQFGKIATVGYMSTLGDDFVEDTASSQSALKALRPEFYWNWKKTFIMDGFESAAGRK